jgi:hypothetical protein
MAEIKKTFFVVTLLVLQIACLTTFSWGQPYGGGPGGGGYGGGSNTNPNNIKVLPSDYYGVYGPIIYSGTNCGIGGPAVTSVPGASITFMTLEINGVQVASATFPHDPNNPHSGRTLSAIFASTHFTDGTTVTWKLTAEDNLGNKNSKTHSGTVYNKAGIYVAPNFPSVSGAISAFQSMNHTINNSSGITGGLLAASAKTAFHFSGHGINDSPPRIGILEEGDDPEESTPEDIRNYKLDNDAPRCNIAFLGTCLASSTNEFAQTILNPTGMGSYGGTLINQAQVGWTMSVIVGNSDDYATLFWQSLADGDTADQARRKIVNAWIASPDDNEDEMFHLVTESNDEYGRFAHCWGDFYSTLGANRVYTGSSASMGWIRSSSH